MGLLQIKYLENSCIPDKIPAEEEFPLSVLGNCQACLPGYEISKEHLRLHGFFLASTTAKSVIKPTVFQDVGEVSGLDEGLATDWSQASALQPGAGPAGVPCAASDSPSLEGGTWGVRA